MKRGEALDYIGRKDEARAQYRIASTLYLNVADKVELARDGLDECQARHRRVVSWLKS